MAYVAKTGVKLVKELKEYQAKDVAQHISDISKLSQTEAEFGTCIMAGRVSGLTSALSSILRYKVNSGEITEKERKEYEKKIDEEAKKPLVSYMKPTIFTAKKPRLFRTELSGLKALSTLHTVSGEKLREFSGSKGHPGHFFDRVVKAGYATRDGEAYAITQDGMNIIIEEEKKGTFDID